MTAGVDGQAAVLPWSLIPEQCRSPGDKASVDPDNNQQGQHTKDNHLQREIRQSHGQRPIIFPLSDDPVNRDPKAAPPRPETRCDGE